MQGPVPYLQFPRTHSKLRTDPAFAFLPKNSLSLPLPTPPFFPVSPQYLEMLSTLDPQWPHMEGTQKYSFPGNPKPPHFPKKQREQQQQQKEWKTHSAKIKPNINTENHSNPKHRWARHQCTNMQNKTPPPELSHATPEGPEKFSVAET